MNFKFFNDIPTDGASDSGIEEDKGTPRSRVSGVYIVRCTSVDVFCIKKSECAFAGYFIS